METHYGELSIDRVEKGVLITQDRHDLVRLTDDEIEPFIELLVAASAQSRSWPQRFPLRILALQSGA
jgi:hypothetical protein